MPLPSKLNGAVLRQKGYQVLPVRSRQKHCSIVGWNTLDNWEGEAPGLGLNLVGLVMVDVDFDLDQSHESAALVQEVLELCPDSGALFDAPWRSRPNSVRMAVLMRCSEVDHLRFTTPRWTQGKVEFKIGRGEFMFGWGRHPSGGELSWVWDDDQKPTPDPVRFPNMRDIPAISVSSLREWCSAIEAFLTEKWGAPLSQAHEFSTMEATADLTWDMEFTLADGSLASLRDLYKGPGTSEFVNLTPWRPDSDSLGGHVSHSYTLNAPTVTDFVTGVVHTFPPVWEQMADPIDVPGELQTIPAIVEKKLEAATSLAEEAKRLQRLIFLRDRGRYVYVDDPSNHDMSPAGAFHGIPRREWAKIAETIPAVERQTWDPRLPPLEVITDPYSGWSQHNSFGLPRHPPTGGTAKPFYDFMKGFIPDTFERETIIDWMAYKVQNPWVRGWSLIVVGPQGSGKGTLWKILGALWEPRHVSNIGTISAVYSGAYQDPLYKKLFVLVDEVSADDTSHQGRRAAYEKLKAFCEPQTSDKVLNIKGGPMVDAVISATVGIATNHIDGVPVITDDRRFFVASTGSEMTPQSIQSIQEWVGSRENVGALWRELERRSVTGFSMMRAPASAGKEDMALANENEVDTAAREFLDLVRRAGGVYTATQADAWRKRYIMHLGDSEMKGLKRELQRFSSHAFKNRANKTIRARILDPSLKFEPGRVLDGHIDELTKLLDEAGVTVS